MGHRAGVHQVVSAREPLENEVAKNRDHVLQDSHRVQAAVDLLVAQDFGQEILDAFFSDDRHPDPDVESVGRKMHQAVGEALHCRVGRPVEGRLGIFGEGNFFPHEDAPCPHVSEVDSQVATNPLHQERGVKIVPQVVAEVPRSLQPVDGGSVCPPDHLLRFARRRRARGTPYQGNDAVGAEGKDFRLQVCEVVAAGFAAERNHAGEGRSRADEFFPDPPFRAVHEPSLGHLTQRAFL